MSRGVHTIEGVGPRYAQVLKEAGVSTTDQLLQAGSTSKGTCRTGQQDRPQQQAYPQVGKYV